MSSLFSNFLDFFWWGARTTYPEQDEKDGKQRFSIVTGRDTEQQYMQTFFDLKLRDSYDYKEANSYQFSIRRNQIDIVKHRKSLKFEPRDFNTEYNIVRSLVEIQPNIIRDIRSNSGANQYYLIESNWVEQWEKKKALPPKYRK